MRTWPIEFLEQKTPVRQDVKLHLLCSLLLALFCPYLVMAVCLISLGANLGDRAESLKRAADSIHNHAEVTTYSQSKTFATAPIGGPAGQGEFLNAAARIETTLSPHDFFAFLQELERDLGRNLGERWAPRVIDLDLLLYEDCVLDTPTMRIPHPRMAFRRFVLEPAADVASEMVHPQIGWTVGRLLENLNTATDYIAITGAIGTGTSRLAKKVAQRANARLIDDDVDDDELLRSDVALTFELRMLRRRADLLDAQHWPSDTDVAVSNFWFDQSVALSQIWPDDDQKSQLKREWREFRQRVMLPKLLILLELPADQLVQAIKQITDPLPQSFSADKIEQLCTALRDQVTQPNQGPFLRLDASDPNWAIEELTAAIETMRKI